jgi:esterase/lipase superfamily enzyme/Tfp pilus assembly protein PilF
MRGKLLRAALVAGFVAGAGQALGDPSGMPSPILTPPPQYSVPSPSLPAPALIPTPVLPSNTHAELTGLYQTIVGFYAGGKYAEAIPLAEEYVAQVGKHTGDTEGLVYANAISLLSRLYQMQGRYQEAEQFLVRSLEILEHKGGAEGDVATELDALAQLYESQGEFAKAEQYFVRALVISEKNAASDPRRYGRALNNLAWVYQDQSRYTEAQPLASQALDVLATAFGKKDPDYGCTLDTLAKLYEGQNRKAEAELLYRQALTVLEAALGPEHVSTAATRENLGGLLKATKQLDEAEQLLLQALATKERVFGGNHPTVAKTLSQLGDLYRLQGRQEQADARFKRAFAIHNGALIKIPVFFVTDRERAQDLNGIAFGSVRSPVLTFGRAIVALPKPHLTSASPRPAAEIQGSVDTRGAAAVEPSADAILPLVKTTELTHLAISSLAASGKAATMQGAARRLGIRGEALVFVHGFNVDFENALFRAAQISYDTKFDGPVFLFSWAANDSIRGYFGDNEGTGIVGEHLLDFVKAIVGETKVKRIHFIAHSMGNLVLLNALGNLTRDPSLRPLIGEIINAAPDVKASVFEHMVLASKGNGSSFTLYASRGDWALWTSGLIRGEPRAGFIGDKALIVPGVETIDVTDAGTGYFGLNHDVYAANPVLVEDMKRIFKDRKHPPDQRTGTFVPVATNGGTYWRYHRADAKTVASPRISVPPSGQPVQAPPSAAPSAGGLPPPSAIIAPGAVVAPPSVAAGPAAETPAAIPTQAPEPAAPMAAPPPPDATAAIPPPPAKRVQRKKRKKPDFDLTKPLQ